MAFGGRPRLGLIETPVAAGFPPVAVGFSRVEALFARELYKDTRVNVEVVPPFPTITDETD